MGYKSMLFIIVACSYSVVDITQSLPVVSASTSRAQQQSQLIKYLTEFGYLPAPEEGNLVDHTDVLPSAIAKFQDMARLPVTGILDRHTVNMMSQPRCGVKDPAIHRRRRYLTSGGKWNKHILTWHVSRFSDRLSNDEVLHVLRQAFKAWSSVTNLHFEYRSTGIVDIEIKFISGSHGDGYRFDGNGGILAHAFSPPHSSASRYQSIAGNLHLDDSEHWVIDFNDSGENLYNVVVHEIGHSLGLEHSNAPGSVMWPWSADIRSGTRAKLNKSDIKAIQTLYGNQTQTRFQRDENSHYLCRMHVDALMTAENNKIYAFNGATVTLLDPVTFNPIDGALSISSLFPFFPNDTSVDAAMSFQGFWPTKSTYLFTGHTYYRYSLKNGEMSLDDGYPKNISIGWGMDEHSFDSSFKYRNENTLIFVKGMKYWIHTGTNQGSYPGYPSKLSESPHPYSSLPGIDAAFLHRNGTNYFLSAEHVYMRTEQISNGALVQIC